MPIDGTGRNGGMTSWGDLELPSIKAISRMSFLSSRRACTCVDPELDAIIQGRALDPGSRESPSRPAVSMDQPRSLNKRSAGGDGE
jgi:hypothetical protein